MTTPMRWFSPRRDGLIAAALAWTLGLCPGASYPPSGYAAAAGTPGFDAAQLAPGSEPGRPAPPDAVPIDRPALVARHNPVVRRVDPFAPLSVGNGGFAFTSDITGLQTFDELYYQNGIPLETLARWCWTSDPNPAGFSLDDVMEEYTRADGTKVSLPSRTGTPAADWLRRNPRLHPLGQLALVWGDGTDLVPGDIEDPAQVLDLWRGVITSRYRLSGSSVVVTTACDPRSDTLAVRVSSELVTSGRLRLRLRFARGHDVAIKNTPPLDWTHAEAHESTLLSPTLIRRRVSGTEYFVATSLPLQADGPHSFLVATTGSSDLEFSVRFSPAREAGAVDLPSAIVARSAEHWAAFWNAGAAVDFSGSTNPLADKLENRVVLSQYLTAIQCAGAMPPQESGLTCNTWYGKHHTEMIWWHSAHFVLWGRPELTAKNLVWFLDRLPEARALAASRGLPGARWAKMVGPDGRESPGGNPLIVWNQPHPIHLCELLWRQSPSPENLSRYRDLVLETAECMASMLVLEGRRGARVLGPPVWIAQEIHDPATSQNPTFELAYWRWALETAQCWRVRCGLGREPRWDEVIAQMPPLPQKEGRYVALESHPDTWDTLASRHDHPEMLMALGFLPETAYVDPAIMRRTLDGVLREWDWETKIWGWDYPMVAMTATRLGRPADAIEVLLRDGPNNRYLPNGHCPQGSDRAQASQSEGRREIAVYLPANGSFLAAVALMVAGWDGCAEPFPGFPKDGSWTIRAEGLQRLP